jgi:hypothetical protein
MTPERLKRVLLSLGEPGLRLGWLTAELGHMPRREAATLLNAVLEESEAAEPDAREVLLTIALLLVHPEQAELVDALRAEASENQLFGLSRALRRGPPPSIHAPPPEEQRIPDYGVGRELTLGERKSLARRPDRRSFDKLVLDPHPHVIRQLLENPKMIEDDAIRLATIRPARADVIRELARSHRWLSRPRVRMAILLNPGSPAEVAMPLLGLCNREELRDVLRSTETSLVLRSTAQELLVRKPPMRSEPPETVH